MEGFLLDDETLVKELIRIVDYSKKKGIIVRGLGAVAIRTHSHGFEEKCPDVKRPLTDLDFITYSRYDTIIGDVFKNFGYLQDRVQSYLKVITGRSILKNPDTHITVDLYFDKLIYNHVISLEGRLEQDAYTIPLADLVLEKMQIVQINEKDVKDVILLLREHPLGVSDQETVNINRICKVLSEDWGFYFTVINNLDKVSRYVDNLETFNENDRRDILQKIGQLKKSIESSPKSLSWKIRAKIGTKKKWYNDVEELYSGH